MNHLDLAFQHWKQILKPTDTAIDATCGNGKDTLRLAQLLPQGKVIGIDIQEQATQNTALRVSQHSERVYLFCQSHAAFPQMAYENPIKLIVYNLGYLPGGDKKLTTKVFSSLESIQKALELISDDGAVSVTTYPGHPEGALEHQAIQEFFRCLYPLIWDVFHSPPCRPSSPHLFFIKKNH